MNLEHVNHVNHVLSFGRLFGKHPGNFTTVRPLKIGRAPKGNASSKHPFFSGYVRFWGCTLSKEGVCLQSKGDERVLGINSNRIVVTCII